jgi:alpha-tubulin suppressor-like RCC1 family protein
MSIEPLSNFTVVPDINQNTVTMSWSNPASILHSIAEINISDSSNSYTTLAPLSAYSNWVFNNGIKVVQIDSGSQHTAILLSNGKVMTFGSNTFGQLGLPFFTVSSVGGISIPTEVPDISNAVAISCGRNHTAILVKTGRVYLFGLNVYGQLGSSVNITTNNPNPTPLLLDIQNVALVECGGHHTVIVLHDGTTLAFGNNQRGQLGNGDNTGSFINHIPQLVQGVSNPISVSCGNEFTAFLLNDGRVATCGINLRGQLGRLDNNSTSNINPIPNNIPLITNVKSIACGFEHLILLLNNGTLYSCGTNLYGNLGILTNSGRITANPTPQLIPDIANVSDITCGIYHTVVLTEDQKVYTFGLNQSGQLASPTNYGNSSANSVPYLVPNTDNIISIGAGGAHTILLQRNGQIKLFGSGQQGQLGNSQSDVQLFFEEVVIDNLLIAKSGPTAHHSIFVLGNTKIKSCGYNNYGQLGVGNPSIIFNSTPIESLYNGIVDVACGSQHTLTLQSTKEVCSFGYNFSGQLGITTNSGLAFANVTPSKIPNIRNAKQVSAGNSHSAILTTTGQVLTFGLNQRGQLGRSTNVGLTTANPTPTAIDISNAISVSCGANHTAVLLSTGQVVTFGLNLRGQLGRSTNINTNNPNPIPTLIPGINTAIDVKCGGEFTLILLSNGTVMACGLNQRGQLGISTNYGNQNPVSTPTPIQGINNAIAIDCGNEYSVITLSNKTLLSFGMNQFAQLGHITNSGNTLGTNIPTIVPDMSNVKCVATGHSHFIVQTTNNKIYSIGYNIYGQLGDNYYLSTINQINPNSINYNPISPIVNSIYTFRSIVRKGILSSLYINTLLRLQNLEKITNVNVNIDVDYSSTVNRSLVTLSWNPLPNIMHYRIYRINNNFINTIFADFIYTNSYSYTTLADTEFSLIVVGYYPTEEEGIASDIIRFKTQRSPSQIKDFAIHKVDNSYLLSWSPLNTFYDRGDFDIINYNIEYKKHYELEYTNLVTLDQNSTTYTLSGLENGVEYTFRIYASNPVANGPISYIDPIIPCIPGWEKILTPTGFKKVSLLKDGDLVITNLLKQVPIKKIYHSTITTTKETAPYRFEVNSITKGYPSKAFDISPTHAISYGSNWIIPKYAYLSNIKAKQIHIGEKISYYHIELPDYLNDNLIIEGGAIVESFGLNWLKSKPKGTVVYEFNHSEKVFKRKKFDNFLNSLKGKANK